MNKFIILLLLLNVNYCNRSYNGNFTFVRWDKINKEFVNTSIEVGSLRNSLNVESYKKEGNFVKVEISIFQRYLKSSKIETNNTFYILGNNINTKEIDTILIFNKLNEKFQFNERIYDFLVFIKSDEEIGTKCYTKDF